MIAGVVIPEKELRDLTHDWIELKARFNPDIRRVASKGWLDAILHDLKGTKIRRGFRASGTRRQRKHAIGLIDGTLKLLERHDAQIVGRVWVKELDGANDAMALYQSSLQFICGAFHSQIPTRERGLVVVDSQTYWHNHRLAHSVFTQRFGSKPKHEKLADMPVFGHSDNHAGLQIADLLCSAVLAPVASAVYAGAYSEWNSHCDSGFLDIRDRFGPRLEALTFSWQNDWIGRKSPSLVVNDPIRKRASALMWGPNVKRRRKRRSSGRGRTSHKRGR